MKTEYNFSKARKNPYVKNEDAMADMDKQVKPCSVCGSPDYTFLRLKGKSVLYCNACKNLATGASQEETIANWNDGSVKKLGGES